ncbi:hypothetical protein SCLCIDRAFT_1132544 [Scleroderma citrinum Foug A]|uniref:Uncharacterized protein n=1 Tax=Scleroderma citrinum Foug A TaxID=1036808 RepID=A0A0C2Z6C3_9AGAM|nr:hypothetical protein SCLCIDRAFT_1132544 [Scleroderma citrinum Foug A]
MQAQAKQGPSPLLSSVRLGLVVRSGILKARSPTSSTNHHFLFEFQPLLCTTHDDTRLEHSLYRLLKTPHFLALGEGERKIGDVRPHPVCFRPFSCGQEIRFRMYLPRECRNYL